MSCWKLFTPVFVVFAILFSGNAHAQDAKLVDANAKKLLKSLEGKWEGSCKTWLRPDELGDESKVTGEIKLMPGVAVIRHTYEGSFKGKARSGEESIAFDTPEGEFQVSWFDTFHMNYAILFSRGKPNKDWTGFSVTGKYRVQPEKKHWGWRTEYDVKDADNLTVTAYNITPDGKEAKATELIYKRVK